jgi:hypothetical protein
VTPTDAMAFVDGQRGHDVGLDAPHELLRSVEGISGKVELRLELAPRPEYGLVMPLVRLDEAGARTFGGSGRVALSSGIALKIADSTITATFEVAAGELVGFALRWAPPEDRNPPPPTSPDAVAERVEETAEAWRSWEREHDIYGPAQGTRASQLTRPQGPDLSADGSDRRRTHDLPAGDRWRRAQLGLPLCLDPRLQHDDRGPLHRRLPGGGRGVRLVHDQLGRGPRRSGLAADHVRRRRRTRSLGARTRPPARLARFAARYASGTGPGSRCSSTSTASC